MAADGTRPLDFGQELVVDLFAGGGGASSGIALAYREPDVAVNHSPIAVAVHRANHPNTLHFQCDVFEVDPIQATGGRPVGILWASPDCRHHSKAKGGKPRSKKIRSLAWVVIKWATACRPRLIMLENVEEFADWGPLDAEGKPCPKRKGMTFRRWIKQLENQGYKVEYRQLTAADYETPTIRKRLYVIARCDGQPIVWPAATHAKGGAGGLKAWRSAAECINWSLPARSIFDRPKPLAINTQRRIAKGLCRYVLDAAEPFIVEGFNEAGRHPGQLQQPVASERLDRRTSTCPEDLRGSSVRDLSARADLVPSEIHPSCRSIRPTDSADFAPHAASFSPFLTEHANASNQRVFNAQEPLRTQVAQVKGGHFALVSAFMVAGAHGEGKPGGIKRWGDGSKSAFLPSNTVTASAGGGQAVATCAFMEQANGGFYDGDGRSLAEPVSTVCTSGANQRLVTAYFVKWYGNEREGVSPRDPMHTVTTKDRIGVVQTVQVPEGILSPEQRDKARQCADLLHRMLPDRFPVPADMVLVGDYVLVDITLRMLAPRELARAQGFPDSYELERGWFVDDKSPAGEWRPITKTDQVRLIGNSVCPNVAAALVAANAADLIRHYAEAA